MTGPHPAGTAERFAIAAAAFGVVALSCLSFAVPEATAATPTGTPAGSGWIRFGHFVSNAAPVNVKVDGTTIGTGIGFHDVTGYVLVHAGSNTLSVYGASSAAGASPIASIDANVPSGGAVTVAAFASTGVTTSGSGSVAGGVALSVFTDNLSAPPSGEAKIRVIHTIPGAPVVDTQLKALSSGSTTPSVNLSPVGYKQASAYAPADAGKYDVIVKTTGGTVVTQGTDWQAVASTIVTIVILEAPSGPSLEILSDATGAGATPNGAMQTGLGGTAPTTNLAREATVPVAVALIVLLGAACIMWRSSRRTVGNSN
jgi:Domain of unknown function (DUF4397)